MYSLNADKPIKIVAQNDYSSFHGFPVTFMESYIMASLLYW